MDIQIQIILFCLKICTPKSVVKIQNNQIKRNGKKLKQVAPTRQKLKEITHTDICSRKRKSNIHVLP